MPVWNNTQPIELLGHLRPITVMDATVMTDAQATVAVALPASHGPGGITVAMEVKFASNPPGAVDYRLQVAFNNVAAEFQDVSPFMTNTETIGGIVSVANIVGRFARVLASDADTVAVTITIMRQ